MWSLISIEFFIIAAIVFGLLGRYIAKQKNRSGAEGFWLGILFSALGVIIVALLPNKEEEKSTVLVNKEGLPKDEKSNSSAAPILVGYAIVLLVIFYLLFIS